MIHADTIVEILCRRIEESGEEEALAVKRGGQFQWVTWNNLAADVARMTAVLVELGVQPGDRVAHVSENRYEWVIADFAIQMAGAIHVPIHAPMTGQQVAWQVKHSGAKVLLLSGPEQAAKLAPLASELPAALKFVSYDPCPAAIGGRQVAKLSELQEAADLQKGIDAACRTRKEDHSGFTHHHSLHLRHHRRAEGRDADAGESGVECGLRDGGLWSQPGPGARELSAAVAHFCPDVRLVLLGRRRGRRWRSPRCARR